MKVCVLCSQPIVSSSSWASFFMPQRQALLCESCEKKFQVIAGELCHCCGRMLAHIDEAYRKGDFCLDCIRWQQQGEVLDQNRSLYVYDEAMKEWMNQFKFRGDVILAQCFAKLFRKMFRQHFQGYTVIPVPISEERLQERGFNQAEILVQLLGVPYICPLVRVHGQKQSKKSKRARMLSESTFRLQSPLHGATSILIVDDVYTTGTTVRQIATLFREQGAQRVSSLTLCRG